MASPVPLVIINMLFTQCVILLIIFNLAVVQSRITLAQGQHCPNFILGSGRVKLKNRGQFAIFKCYRSFSIVGATKGHHIITI